VIRAIIAEYQELFPQRIVRPIAVFRSLKDQQAAFKKGASQKDGVEKPSKHQHLGPTGEPQSLAVDLGVFTRDGRYLTNAKLYYFPFLALGEKHGLRSGGDWDGNGILDTDERPNALADLSHLEWIGEVA
jgi:hypothetical protein